MIDVLIVGGGPAGCYTAALLGERGFDVHVLEEHSIIGEPVDCSGVIGAEAFDELELPESLKLGAISNLTLVSPSQLEIKFSPSSALAYVVDRAAFDQVIATRTEQSGVTMHLGCQVVDLRVLNDCVELDVKEVSLGQWCQGRSTINQLPLTNNKVERKVRGKMAILAGGPRYNLQQKLEMGQPRDFLRTSQAELPIKNINEAKILLGSHIAPGSFAWIVPFERGDNQFARVGVSSKSNAAPFLKKLIEQLYSEGQLMSLDASIRSWLIPVTPLKRSFAERVIAVGDAAGQTKPTTGGGIYYGLIGARAAAQTAVRAFESGDFSSRMLRSYEREWRRRLGGEMRSGAFFRRLVERLTDEEIDGLFRIVQSDGILAAVTSKARFDWHKDIVHFTLRHPELGKIFLRGLFR